MKRKINFTDLKSHCLILHFTVPDTTDPEVLTCPSDIASTVTNIGDCVEVSWTVPIATDDSVAVIGGESNFDPGSCFPLGLTPVLYTFTDPSGNSATCSFEVTVTLEVGELENLLILIKCPQ